jgi:hypothetical protein
MINFKDGIKRLNCHRKVKKELNEKEKKEMKLKHDQNKRACERRGLP